MLFILLLLLPNYVQMQKPNVCKKFIDYLTMDPKNCWYNPDVFLDAIDLIKSHGYPYEQHEAETEDGYLLTMYRIPRYDSDKVIYLQHPATTTCTGWIDKGNDSLAFMLWDKGYDIWMGNFRGNYYSRKHKFLNPDEEDFWDFSFHELGYYDIPNQIDYIVNQTNVAPGKILFIGFSMSSTAGLIYASEKPEHAKKWLNLMILMAPSSYMTNTLDIIKHISNGVNGIQEFSEDMGIHEIIPHNKFFMDLQSGCRSGISIVICMVVDLIMFGNLPEEINPEWYPIMHAQVPGGMSVKPYHHYMQMVKSKTKFQQFDYGKEENMKRYKSKDPPEYDVSKIEVPVYLMYADHDVPVNPADVEQLYDRLQPKAKIYGKRLIKNFAHQSFFYGVHVVDWIYKPIIKLINEVFSKNK